MRSVFGSMLLRLIQLPTVRRSASFRVHTENGYNSLLVSVRESGFRLLFFPCILAYLGGTGWNQMRFVFIRYQFYDNNFDLIYNENCIYLWHALRTAHIQIGARCSFMHVSKHREDKEGAACGKWSTKFRIVVLTTFDFPFQFLV